MTQQTQPKRFVRKLLSSKAFLFSAILILSVLVVNLGRESYRKYQLTKEINKLESEINQLEGKNKQLADMMEYFKDESYLEKEARLKLNLKKPGEKVVILSPRKEEISESESAEERLEQARKQEVNGKSDLPNHWKWWEYFFK